MKAVLEHLDTADFGSEGSLAASRVMTEVSILCLQRNLFTRVSQPGCSQYDTNPNHTKFHT